MGKFAILGATKGMGREIARLLAQRGDAIALLGRNLAELERSAADLAQRAHAGQAQRGQEQRDPLTSTIACDLASPESFGPAIHQARQDLGGLDGVIVTAASFATQEALEADGERARQLLTINVANTIAFCEHARKDLLAHGSGSLVVFSSVAGDRGRKPVGIYGASKAAVSAYLESMDHKFHAQGLHVLCVKPGFVRTPMTSGLPEPPFAGEADQVAKAVVKAMDKKKPLIYAPSIWGWIMLVIRNLPRFVMRKVNF